MLVIALDTLAALSGSLQLNSLTLTPPGKQEVSLRPSESTHLLQVNPTVTTSAGGCKISLSLCFRSTRSDPKCLRAAETLTGSLSVRRSLSVQTFKLFPKVINGLK